LLTGFRKGNYHEISARNVDISRNVIQNFHKYWTAYQQGGISTGNVSSPF
jgi:hypothetical protein